MSPPRLGPSGLTRDKQSSEQPSNDPWAAFSTALFNQDTKLIEKWKEEIDTLLVFAGLFSAVLTAFNVDSYKFLQEDQGEATVRLLTQISLQLTSFTVNSAFINSTLASTAMRPDFHASPTSIIINCFWFSSLLFSLTAASIAIFVKQWLRDYTVETSTVPRDRTGIRQYRYQGLVKWRVSLIISSLPFLLHLSLILFFLGLLVLLWTLNSIVAGVSTALVSLSLLFWLVTAILPIIYSDCPYKSTLAEVLFYLTESLKDLLRAALASHAHLDPKTFPPPELFASLTVKERINSSLRSLSTVPHYHNWRDREIDPIRDHKLELECQALISADSTFFDDQFLYNVIRPCIRTVDANSAIQCFRTLIESRTGCPVASLGPIEIPKIGHKLAITLVHFSADILFKIHRVLNPDEDNSPLLPTVVDILEFTEKLLVHIILDSNSESASESRLIRGGGSPVYHSSQTIPADVLLVLLELLSRTETIKAVASRIISPRISYWGASMRSEGLEILKSTADHARSKEDVESYIDTHATTILLYVSWAGDTTVSRDNSEHARMLTLLGTMLDNLEHFFQIPISRVLERPKVLTLCDLFSALWDLANADGTLLTVGLVEAAEAVMESRVTRVTSENLWNFQTDDLERGKDLIRKLKDKVTLNHLGTTNQIHRDQVVIPFTAQNGYMETRGVLKATLKRDETILNSMTPIE